MSFESKRFDTAATSYRVLSFHSPYPDRIPVVLLHGFLGAGVLWSRLAESWCEERPVYAVDLPGHGGSHLREPPQDFNALSKDLAELLHQLDGGRAAHLLGYSLGGRLAIGSVAIGNYRPASLILESVHPGLTTAADRGARRRWEDEWYRLLRAAPMNDFIADWEAQPLLRSRERNPAATRQRLEVMRSQTPAHAARVFDAARLSGQPYFDEDLARVDFAVTWISGELDAKYTRLHERACAPTHSTTTVPDAGHTVHSEQPDAYGHIVINHLRAAEGVFPLSEGEESYVRSHS